MIAGHPRILNTSKSHEITLKLDKVKEKDFKLLEFNEMKVFIEGKNIYFKI